MLSKISFLSCCAFVFFTGCNDVQPVPPKKVKTIVKKRVVKNEIFDEFNNKFHFVASKKQSKNLYEIIYQNYTKDKK